MGLYPAGTRETEIPLSVPPFSVKTLPLTLATTSDELPPASSMLLHDNKRAENKESSSTEYFSMLTLAGISGIGKRKDLEINLYNPINAGILFYKIHQFRP